MNQSNSIEAIEKTKLTEQRKFRLDEISKIENYFHEEINQRKSCSKKLSKYVAAFDYIDKILIVLSATTGGVSICLFTSIIYKYNLPKKTKDGSYVINFDEYADVVTHWIALFCNKNEIVYFDSFGVEHVPEEIK